MIVKKYFLLVLLVGSLSQISAQPVKPLFNFDHIPSGGDTMLTGWRYHPGDNSAWAGTTLQDSSWDALDPIVYLSDFMKKYPEHIGWFRLKFAVADSLRNRIVGFSSDIFGATELYLNGKLLRKLGKVDADSSKVVVENSGDRPFPMMLSNDSIQVLAIRFAYKKKELYVPELNRRITLTANIGNADMRFGNLPRMLPIWIYYLGCFFVGLNFVLLVLHGSFYAYFRQGRQNLFYAGYTLFSAFTWTEALILLHEHELHLRMLNTMFMNTSILFMQAFLVMTIYTFFAYQKRMVIGVLLIASVAGFILQFYAGEIIGFAVINLLPILYIFEALRVTWKARQRRERGAVTILSGIFLYILFWIATFICFASQHLYLGAFFIYLGAGCLMVLMSIAIARQLANTNIELQGKLSEVEELSKEKEDMLMRQNIILEEKVQLRTAELNESINHLKQTQSQLIHAEKMAGLGELTAGIAHEIQNPLNFVNNFSEVNIELMEELKNEKLKDPAERDDKLESLLLKDIAENLVKINHHGKRADAIVKGMLQHSRKSSGQKEPTDINALVNEFSGLAYRAQRSKDASFNANLVTEFDESIGMIKIIPQDIGRTILNLIANAFYSTAKASIAANEMYEPTVTIGTKKLGDKVFITVKDNGVGIPEKIADKIFQPFFTTKPTGEGTGLGLSLSYDIITKGHNGVLTVTSKEGEGAVFTIELPIE
jgi:signal transduction histidine kinase